MILGDKLRVVSHLDHLHHQNDKHKLKKTENLPWPQSSNLKFNLLSLGIKKIFYQLCICIWYHPRLNPKPYFTHIINPTIFTLAIKHPFTFDHGRNA